MPLALSNLVLYHIGMPYNNEEYRDMVSDQAVSHRHNPTKDDVSYAVVVHRGVNEKQPLRGT